MSALPDVNLEALLLCLALAGAVLSIWAMSLSAQNYVGRDEKNCLRWVRRSAFALIAGGLLWSASYGMERDWQPWPPFLMLVTGVDLVLLATVITGHLRQAEQVKREVMRRSS